MGRDLRTGRHRRAQKAVARCLREARERLGKSQATVADELGVSQATVSDWESGKYGPALFRARDVARVYELGLDAVLPEAA